MCTRATGISTSKGRIGVPRPRPLSVILKIEHSAPNPSDNGTVAYASEEERPFGFSGAFDGKPYPMSRSFGDGEIVMKRIDPYTVESLFRTPDAQYVESA